MSVALETQTRVNRLGSVCPDWCQTDHERANMCTGRVIDTHMSAAMASDSVYPRVILSQHGDTPAEVHVSGMVMPGYVFISPGMAGDLADLVESLAGCTPQRLRDLAEEIRIAASALL